MMALNGKHVQPLTVVYQNFWQKLTKITEGKAKSISKELLKVKIADGKAEVEIGILQINGAPSRPGGHKNKKYKIFLQSLNTVVGAEASAPPFILTRCLVRALWLEDDVAVGVKPRVVRGVHFDLSNDAHHPVFHAQINNRVFRPDELGIEYEDDSVRHDTPRIPTAPMDLCGTMYMILHDHFSSAVSAGWSPDCINAINEMPRMPCTPISSIVKSIGRLDCAMWYPPHQS